jgi:predicted thioesterase
MFRGRGKHVAMAAGATVLMAAASLAVVPLVASAAGSATSTSVVAHPASTTTGHAVTIVAKVSAVTAEATTTSGRAMRFTARKAGHAATANASVPTGTVTFTITGADASTVSCKTTNVVTIKHSGKATCKVSAGMLAAVASPYSVDATYSGDANFAGSTGNTSITVAAARTKVIIKKDSKPMSGTGNTFTAIIKGGSGGSQLAGTVVFSVSDTPSQSKALRTCQGGDTQPVAVTGNVGTATCVLQPGWFIVPSPNHATPHPHGAWNVTASYSGNGNFVQATGTKSGHSKS